MRARIFVCVRARVCVCVFVCAYAYVCGGGGVCGCARCVCALARVRVCLLANTHACVRACVDVADQVVENTLLFLILALCAWFSGFLTKDLSQDSKLQC